MNGRALGAAVGLAAGLVLLTATAARSDDPVTSAVRYNREIVRIFDRKCLSCHGPEGMAMSLASYREVRPWSRAIREEIVEGHMPPASSVRGYARLKDDIGLTPRELATILTWVDGGVPRGDEGDLPPRPKGVAPPPADHAISLPEQRVPGNGADVVRHLTVDPGLENDAWVRALQIRPGERRLLRAAFVSIVSATGTPVWAGSWVPWQEEVSAMAPGAFRLARGSRLNVELHYRGGEAPAMDKSSLNLYFAGEGTWRPMETVALTPAPRGKVHTTLAREASLWGVRLGIDAGGGSVELTARKPDGAVEVLLWVPRTRADWPAPFIFQEPVPLPAGTVITLTTTGSAQQLRTRALLTLHDAN